MENCRSKLSRCAKEGQMYLAVKAVQPLENYELLLTFENQEQRRFDCKPLLSRGVYRELSDNRLFFSAKLSFDSVAWCNGADIDPQWLYEQSVPVAMH
jgi:hypothetical protein